MVLEYIFKGSEVERHPYDMFIFGILLSMVGVILAQLLLPENAALLLVAIITIGAIPLAQRVLGIEEKKERYDYAAKDEKERQGFLKRHRPVIFGFAYFFFGVALTLSAIAFILPQGISARLFSIQIETIQSISGGVPVFSLLVPILLNNLKVLLISFVLSIIFASGALLLIVWNASVFAVYIAGALRGSEFASKTLGVQTSLATVMIHVVPEIAGFIAGAIGGGILSFGLVREKWGSPAMRRVLRDAFMLLVLGIILIAIGAFLEVTVV